MTIDGGLTESNAPSTGASSMINVPRWATTPAARGVVYYRRDGGYIDDLRLELTNTNSTETLRRTSERDIEPVAGLDIENQRHLAKSVCRRQPVLRRRHAPVQAASTI